jgi:hypothetical protein
MSANEDNDPTKDNDAAKDSDATNDMLAPMVASMHIANVYNDGLLKELEEHTEAALVLLNSFARRLNIGLNDYGAIGGGVGGEVYTDVRHFLIEQGAQRDLPILRRFLTAPSDHLIEYSGAAGPGGQGSDARRLNTCWGRIHGCIQYARGMIRVIQKYNQDALRKRTDPEA